MATVLLAVENPALREACRRHLALGGHAPVTLDRPLALLTLRRKLAWDAVCVDASELGRGVLDAVALHEDAPAVVGVGLDAASASARVRLPLIGDELLAAVDSLARARLDANEPRRIGPLTLDAGRRAVAIRGRETFLTPTQIHLLDALAAASGRDVSAGELIRSVFGFQETADASDLLRSHVRNLRRRLQAIGLGDAIRSRRGRGYALVI